MLLSDPNEQLPGPTVPAHDDDILVFGQGGVWWSNGSRALSTDGLVSWACALDAPALFNGSRDALALVSETTNELLAWRPGSPLVLRAPLSRLATPVSCVQSGPLLYVACFGVEDQPGRSGLAIIDVATSSWAVVKEVMVGTHVHSLHARDGHLLFADVGDPWAMPPRVPTLGGLRRVAAGLAGAVTRVGPPMHARMVAFVPRRPMLPESPAALASSVPAVGLANGSSSSSSSIPIRRGVGDGDSGARGGGSSEGGIAAASGGVDAYVVTQEPLGQATRVVALSAADWGGFFVRGGDDVVEVASTALPVPAQPSDGGADVFVMPSGGDAAVPSGSRDRVGVGVGVGVGGGRNASGSRGSDGEPDELVYVTDRYAGGGRLFALRAVGGAGTAGGGAGPGAASALDVVGSVALGAHPRYTDPLGSATLICSASRDDGHLTTVDARTLQVVSRTPVHVALPSFLARWPPPRGGAAPADDSFRNRRRMRR